MIDNRKARGPKRKRRFSLYGADRNNLRERVASSFNVVGDHDTADGIADCDCNCDCGNACGLCIGLVFDILFMRSFGSDLLVVIKLTVPSSF